MITDKKKKKLNSPGTKSNEMIPSEFVWRKNDTTSFSASDLWEITPCTKLFSALALSPKKNGGRHEIERRALRARSKRVSPNRIGGINFSGTFSTSQEPLGR